MIVEHRGLSGVLAGASELTGWFAAQLVAPFLAATTPDAVGDWITDRRARRPSGAESRAVYRDPLYHYPNFRVILRSRSGITRLFDDSVGDTRGIGMENV